MQLRRRDFVRSSALAVGGLAFGGPVWRALAAPARLGPGPYGPLQPPDANGLMLPRGFTSRVLAQSGQAVPGTAYVWPPSPDGAATFATGDGGFIMAVNSEIPGEEQGGASAIRFRADGSIASAYPILEGTMSNCAGGGTPWGTWLSCEEHDAGLVWECDPTGARPGVARPALGTFSHEAAAVDPVGQHVYLTEDQGDGGLYRFTPADYPDLSAGVLDVAVVAADGKVSWVRLPDPSARGVLTRKQVPEMTKFRRGEGIWFHEGVIYVATTSDAKIHAYDTRTETMDVVYDKVAISNPELDDLDNVAISPSGDIYVCEDDGGADPLDIGIVTPEGEAARFLKCTGPQHGRPGTDAMSECTGVIFDPSGRRMFFSSQRAYAAGVTYEITGPFRLPRVQPPPPAPGGALGVEAPRRILLRRARASGIPIRLTLDGPGEATAVLTARFTFGGRRRTVTLARARLTARETGGTYTLRLRLSRTARRRLRGRRRSLGATLRVTIAGEHFTRRVVLSVPRARRRRGAATGLATS